MGSYVMICIGGSLIPMLDALEGHTDMKIFERFSGYAVTYITRLCSLGPFPGGMAAENSVKSTGATPPRAN
ncbi:hypothetical protein C8R42DRAFT_685243 [Lentinula raphanica]|nr:hypothetical protein C8R42DRAFT_685243 [Lentinula raphanica]